ncbi:MAG: hypothetical protein KJ941_10165 [Bacteroidetes bacterium]|nr:hypothetical protein [Bacteroidota bacterium]
MKKIALACVFAFGIGMISNTAMASDNSVKTEVSKDKKDKKKRKSKKEGTTCTTSGEKKSCCSKGEQK